MVSGTVTSFSNSFIHSRLPSFFPRPPSRFSFRRIGIQAASLHSSAMSAPEQPSVFFTTSSWSTPASSCTSFKLIRSISLRPTSVGRGMQIRFSRRLRMASSRSHGRLVAPMTTIDLPSSPELTPSILVMSSVLTFLLDSSSFSPRLEARESISSMKMVVGAQNLAISKRMRTSFSESPFHLEAKLEAVTLKKVVLPPEAIAFASSVLPVPGGPNSSTPFQALRMPLKRCGITSGSRTASSSTSLAFSSSAMSSKVMSGLKEITSFYSISIRFESGPFPSGQHDFRKFLRSSSAGCLELGFLALTAQGLLYSLLPLATPLLLLATGAGAVVLAVVFLATGFFLGQISCSRSSNSRSLASFSRCSRSASLASFSLRLQSSSSSCAGGAGLRGWLACALRRRSSWASSLQPFMSLISLSECSSLMRGFSRRASLLGMLPLMISRMLLAISRSRVSPSSSRFHSAIKFLSFSAPICPLTFAMISPKQPMASVYLPRRAQLRARVTSVLIDSSTFDIELLQWLGVRIAIKHKGPFQCRPTPKEFLPSLE